MNIFIKAAIISTLIFIAMFSLGLNMNTSAVEDVKQTIESLQSSLNTSLNTTNKTEIAPIELANISHVNCSLLLTQAKLLGKQSEEVKKNLDKYSDIRSVDKEQYILIKENAAQLFIYSWDFLKKVKEKCNANYTTILYVYKDKHCKHCFEEEVLLLYVKNKLKDDVYVFPIDGEMDISMINSLKEEYNITSYPTLIIDGEKYGFLNLANITKVLCKIRDFEKLC